MPDRDPFAPDVLGTPPDADAPRRPRRRRARFGQVVAQLGARARPAPAATSVAKEAARRDQTERARQILEGGKNKGEQKGYGATASPEHGKGKR